MKMSDVFALPLRAEKMEHYPLIPERWNVVDNDNDIIWSYLDEQTALALAHAINQHDKMVDYISKHDAPDCAIAEILRKEE